LVCCTEKNLATLLAAVAHSFSPILILLPFFSLKTGQSVILLGHQFQVEKGAGGTLATLWAYLHQ
jgi:hypothetical protein